MINSQELLDFLDPVELAAFVLRELKSDATLDQDSSQITKNTIPKVSDMDLYQKMLPKNYFEQSIKGSHEDRFAVSFVLRHQLAKLSLASHLESGLKFDSPNLEPADIELNELFEGTLPIFGFSALGMHVVMRKKGLCRAFDYYDLTTCANASEQGAVFCPDHKNEAFYDNANDLQGATTQAKMLRFYADLSNLDMYSEDELKELVERFWKKLSKGSFVKDDALLAQALEVFELNSSEELSQLGLSGLKKAYLKLAFSSHPDQGGSDDAFVSVKNSFDYLKLCL